MSLFTACCLLLIFSTIVTTTQHTSSPGCSKNGGNISPGTTTETIRGRSYLLSIPFDYSSDTPAPLILSFHGAGQSPSIQLDTDQLTNPNVNDQYIVVYPEAIDVCVRVTEDDKRVVAH